MFDDRRQPLRIPGLDYGRAGAYFLTICVRHRQCLFGHVADERVVLSPLGAMVLDEWLRTPLVRPGVRLDACVVMPNHLHAIVILPGHVSTDIDSSMSPLVRQRLTAGSLGAIVGQFKSKTSRRARAEFGLSGQGLWQRGYFDRVVRDADEHDRIREYIANNPARWPRDTENPRALPAS